MSYRRCTVIGHSTDHKTYTIKDDNTGDIYNSIPYIYLSSINKPLSWDDYFQVGSVVSTLINSIDGKPRSAEIMEIRYDSVRQRVVDIKDIKTGYNSFNVDPSNFYLDVTFVKDW
jgi:hypothetical protein